MESKKVKTSHTVIYWANKRIIRCAAFFRVAELFPAHRFYIGIGASVKESQEERLYEADISKS